MDGKSELKLQTLVSTPFQRLSGTNKCKYVNEWCKIVSVWPINLSPITFFRCGLFFNVNLNHLFYLFHLKMLLPERWILLLTHFWNSCGYDNFLIRWNQWVNYLNLFDSFSHYMVVQGFSSIYDKNLPFSFPLEWDPDQFHILLCVECLELYPLSLFRQDFDYPKMLTHGDDVVSKIRFLRNEKSLSSLFPSFLIHNVRSALEKNLLKNPKNLKKHKKK